MGDEGELLKLSSCHQGSQLWWNDILFMPSQLLLHIYINCAIALVDFDLVNLMGLEDLINIYMCIISQTSTCLCVPRHTHAMTHHATTDIWRLSGHPRVATGHGLLQQTRLCHRPRVLPCHISPYFSWQNPTLMVRLFCHRAVGVTTSQGPPGQEGAGTLWFCPQRVAVATEMPCRVSRSPSWHIGFLVVLLR